MLAYNSYFATIPLSCTDMMLACSSGMDQTPGGKDESAVAEAQRLGEEVDVERRVQLLISFTTQVVFGYVAQVCPFILSQDAVATYVSCSCQQLAMLCFFAATLQQSSTLQHIELPLHSVHLRTVNILRHHCLHLQGLFERHKLIVATQLCMAILKKNGELQQQKFDFLLRGPKVMGMENPLKEWVLDSVWGSVQALKASG